jgi:hypothetical protein
MELMTLDGELVLIGTVFFSMLILHWVNRYYEEKVERNEEESKQLEIDMEITTHIMSKSIRIDDDLHEWLFAKFPKEMSVSDVIRELKELWEQNKGE